MKKYLASFLLLISVSPFLYSQDSELDSLLDAVVLGQDELDFLFEEKKNYHFLYMRSTLTDNTLYAGREIGDNQYNSRLSATYFNSNGIYAGISGAWYSQTDPGYSSTALTLGYSKAVKNLKMLRWRISTDRYYYTDQEFEATFKGNINLGATTRYNNLGFRVDYSILYGQEFSSQFWLSSYLRINILKFGTGNKIQFRPGVSIYMGSETVETESFSGGPRFPNIPTYTTQDVTGLLNAQLSLPITLYLKNWDFQVNYKYNLPNSMDPSYTYPNTSQWTVSLGYLFNTVR